MNNSGDRDKIKKIWMSWSSGKDSSFVLYLLLKEKIFSVSALFTTVTTDYKRVSIHSTRRKLLQLQADRLSLPLEIVEIPKDCSNRLYQKQMSLAMMKAESLNIKYIAFGDLFLESVRQYRENQLQKTKIKPIFPLWKKNTTQLSRNLIDGGFKAVVVAIDKTRIQQDLLGCEYNTEFLKKLPDDVDPCGENGEFHTFVYDAPIFKSPIDYTLGQIVENNDIMYIDLLADD